MPSEAPGGFSPAHVDLEPVWARLAEAGVPFVLHVGGGKLLPKEFHENGRPRPVDWLGGGENLRGKDFPVLHHSPERFLACLVLDGVFQRHPRLRGAAIELGASWVPGMLRNLDHAHRSFSRFEPLLRELELKPSEYIRRQVRFTPFPFEDTAWLIEQCGAELFMFSTDYPHPEGGRRPFEIFGAALAGLRRRPSTTSSSGVTEPSTSGWPDMAGFAAIPKVDLAAAAVGQIRDAILSGDIAAGDELPSERELALQLGINRTTVRDVLDAPRAARHHRAPARQAVPRARLPAQRVARADPAPRPARHPGDRPVHQRGDRHHL